MLSRKRSLKPLITAAVLGAVLLILAFLLSYRMGYIVTNKQWRKTALKLQKSERRIGYLVGSEDRLLLRVTPQDPKIKLVSYLNLPSETADEEQTYKYALKVQYLNKDMEPVREMTLWEKTRKTRIHDPEKNVYLESVFYLNGDKVPADGRVSMLTLSDMNNFDGFLAISLHSPENHTAAVTAFSRVNMRTYGQFKPQIGSHIIDKEDVSSATLYGLDFVTKREKKRSRDYTWEQIPAYGDAGEDYFPQTLFLNDISMAEVKEEKPSQETAPVEYDRTVYYRTAPKDGKEPIVIAVPRIYGGGAFEFKTVCRPTFENETDAGSRPQEAELSYRLHYEFTGSSDQNVYTYQGVTSLSPYAVIGEPENGSEYAGLPSSFHLKAPRDAEEVRFWAGQPLHLAFYASPEQKPAVQRILPEPEQEQAELKMKDESSRTWFYFRPANYDALNRQNRLTEIKLPKGMLDIPYLSDKTVKQWYKRIQSQESAVHIPENYESARLILEPNKPALPELLKGAVPGLSAPKFKWKVYDYYELTPGSPQRFTFCDSRFPSSRFVDVSLLYILDQTSQKPDISIWLDDSQMSMRPLSLIDRRRLENVDAGEHKVLIESGNPADRFFINQEPVRKTEPERWSMRTLYELTDAVASRVKMIKSNDGVVSLNAMVYFSTGSTGYSGQGRRPNYSNPSEGSNGDQAADDFAVIRIQCLNERNMEPGKPYPRKTSLVRTFRIYTGRLPLSDIIDFSDGSSEKWLEPVNCIFPLFEDMPCGEIKFILSLEKGEKVYLRLFSLQEEPREETLMFY